MIGAIIVEQIRDGENRSEETEQRGMISLEQSGVKTSGEKLGRSVKRDNITEREKSRAKRENKILVRRSEQRVRKLL